MCWNVRHTTAMHPDQGCSIVAAAGYTVADGGKRKLPMKSAVDSKCTQLCGQMVSGRFCAKIVPVRVYPSGNRGNCIQMYAAVDEQSNKR